jgi:protein required for attachment to host cells
MIHVLVADTRTVRVLEGSTSGTLVEVVTYRNPVLVRHERDLVSDRPGRVTNPAGRKPQTYEPKVSAKRHSTVTWLKAIGTPLQRAVADRNTDGVVLVAAPRTLAQLRKCLPPSLRKLVAAELPLDLARQPLSALRKRLQPTFRAAARKASRAEPVYRGVRQLQG